jgi:3-oxoacyl-[acyl-carrier-protein] synthase-3
MGLNFLSGAGMKRNFFNQNFYGIREIGTYIPEKRINNTLKQEKFGFKESFLEDKIGVFKTSLKDDNEDCSDMCVKAFNDLVSKISIEKNEIEVIIVVTQNPDDRMPHSGALVHKKLGMGVNCASFDISLGCSGFIYGLSVITSFMKANNMKKGILFTSDPYSKIIDPDDRNTTLLFGDGATATLITNDEPVIVPGKFSFGTLGEKWEEIRLINDKLFMNGAAVVKFVKRYVPDDIRKNIEDNGYMLENIDRFVLHQASKFMVDIVAEDLGVNPSKVPFDIRNYGNTISSSIPLVLEKELHNKENRTILISGFGVGLSYGSCVLKRV